MGLTQKTLEELSGELTNSMQRVAEAGREISDNARSAGELSRLRTEFLVDAEDMQELRDALRGWTLATQAFLSQTVADASSRKMSNLIGLSHDGQAQS